MNEIKTIEASAKTIASLEVAEMLGIPHKEILRKLEGGNDRKGYIEILAEHQMVPSNYFIPDTYNDASGKENKCYQFTKMGCEFFANKFTGEKGVLFSAKYVKRFNEMEEHIQSQLLNLEALSPQLQLLINIETQQKQQAQALADTNKRIDNIGEIITLSPNSWRQDARHLISKIATKLGGFDRISDVNTEINRLVDERGGVSLSTRLTNKKKAMALEGVCKSKRDKLTKVDVIADDKKLIEIYIAIVKEMAVKHGATL